MPVPFPGGVGGLIAGRPAAVYRRDGRLWVKVGPLRRPLDDVFIDHRDDDGRITFRVLHQGRQEVRASYQRRGRGAWEAYWDFWDFTADEPWTWEDGDFGLFLFHVATDTGPMKYRVWFEPRKLGPDLPDEDRVVVDERGVTRPLPGFRRGMVERIEWDDVAEVRAKFELSGIWADPTLLVLSGRGAERCVVPISQVGRLPEGLRPRLLALPGFDARCAAALDDAVAYAVGHPQTADGRSEHGIWKR